MIAIQKAIKMWDSFRGEGHSVTQIHKYTVIMQVGNLELTTS